MPSRWTGSFRARGKYPDSHSEAYPLLFWSAVQTDGEHHFLHESSCAIRVPETFMFAVPHLDAAKKTGSAINGINTYGVLFVQSAVPSSTAPQLGRDAGVTIDKPSSLNDSVTRALGVINETPSPAIIGHAPLSDMWKTKHGKVYGIFTGGLCCMHFKADVDNFLRAPR